MREAEAQLSYTELRAPFDGIVARKLVNLGDLASPGQALLELEETAAFEVEASIPDSLASALTPGAVFACEAGGTRFQAALREVSSAADPASHAIGVILTVPPGTAVRSGQFSRIQVPGSIGRTILAPASAVSLNGQIERVFVVAEGSRAQLRLVKTGSRQTIGQESWQEILSGLAPDERVVIDPPSGLRDGQPLEVRP